MSNLPVQKKEIKDSTVYCSYEKPKIYPAGAIHELPLHFSYINYTFQGLRNFLFYLYI